MKSNYPLIAYGSISVNQLWLTEYGKSDAAWFPGYNIKNNTDSSCLSLGVLALGTHLPSCEEAKQSDGVPLCGSSGLSLSRSPSQR